MSYRNDQPPNRIVYIDLVYLSTHHSSCSPYGCPPVTETINVDRQVATRVNLTLRFRFVVFHFHGLNLTLNPKSLRGDTI